MIMFNKTHTYNSIYTVTQEKTQDYYKLHVSKLKKRSEWFTVETTANRCDQGSDGEL